MTIRVPYLSEETIERDAETLLAEYAYARGVSLKPPIPIEDIIEKHLKLRLEFDDLHERPRSAAGRPGARHLRRDLGRRARDLYRPEPRPRRAPQLRGALSIHFGS